MAEKKPAYKAKARPKAFTVRVVMNRGTNQLLTEMAEREYRTPAQQVIALIHRAEALSVRASIGGWELYDETNRPTEAQALKLLDLARQNVPLGQAKPQRLAVPEEQKPPVFVNPAFMPLGEPPAGKVVVCKLLGIDDGGGGSWEESGPASATVYRCEAEMADYFLRTEKYADFKPLGQFEQYVYFKTV